MIEDELVSFLEWTAGTEIGGAIEIEMARTVAGTIGRLLTKVSKIVASLKTLASAKVIAAAEKVAPGLLKNQLLDELAAQGIKHEPEDIAIWKNAEGKIIFLEKGNKNAGLAHIIGEHGPEFAQAGITEAEIPSLLQEAVTNGTRIGSQGKGSGRAIYEVLFHGKLIKVAITIGSNGFIVGANLLGS